MVASGTRVGGGVISDGRLLVGAGMVAEFGHIQVFHEDGALCGCGRYGCLGQVGASVGIVCGV